MGEVLAGESTLAGAMTRLFEANVLAGDRPATALADDESYWMQIQKAFDADRTMINLNNGGISPTPTHVLEQMIRDLRFVNELPVEHNWRVLEPRMDSTRRELAREGLDVCRRRADRDQPDVGPGRPPLAVRGVDAADAPGVAHVVHAWMIARASYAAHLCA